MTDKKSLKIHYSWIIVIVCSLVMMQGCLCNATIAQNLAVLRETRGFSGKQISLISVFITLSSLLLSMPFFEKIVSRFGTRKPVLAAMVIEGASFILWGVCGSNQILLYLGAIINGVVMPYTATTLIATILIGRWFNKNRGLALGLACTGTGISNFIWAPLIQKIYASAGDKTVFAVEAAAMITAGILYYVFIRDNPEEMGLAPLGGKDFVENGKSSDTCDENRKDLSRTGFFLLILAMTFIGYTAGGCSQNMSLNFRYDGFDPAVIARALSFHGITLAFAKIYVGRFKDKYGMFRTTIVFLTIELMSIALFVAARWVSTPLIVYASSLLFSMGGPMHLMAGPCWSADFSSPASTISYVEKTHMAYLTGQTLGAFLTGVIADVTGYYTAAYVTYGVAIIMGGLIASGLYISIRRN